MNISKLKYSLLFSFSILSGCMSSSQYNTYKSECSNLPFNFDSEYFTDNYEKERTLYILENYLTASNKLYKYTLLSKNSRWNNIEIIINTDDGILEEGYYSLYRDYDFNNCIKTNKYFKVNHFNSPSGSFCVSANEIRNITANVKFIHRSTGVKKSPLYFIAHYNTKVYYKEQLFLEMDSIKYKDNEKIEYCKHEDRVYKKTISDFY